MSELEKEILKPQKIDIAQLSLSLFEIVRRVERGQIKLKSGFNRKQTWGTDIKSKLIESVMLNIPIQTICLSEDEEGIYEFIDGKQRIKTIYEFMNNKFKLRDTVFLQEGQYFSDLEPSVQRKIEDYKVIIFVVKNDNSQYIKHQIFEMINTTGEKLNSQELRSYVYKDKGIPFIRELAQEETFKRVIQNKKVNNTVMQDEELVLRFMSFYYRGYQSYRGNLKKFLNETLDRYDEHKYRENEFRWIFITTMENIYYVFGDNAFLIRPKKRLNRALFEILTYSFANYIRYDIKKAKYLINEELYKLIENEPCFRESVLGTARTKEYKTLNRFLIWEDRFKRILEGIDDK